MVGKVAVVPIVLNVAVDVAGGGSVRNMSLQQNWKVRCVSLSSTLPPRVEAAAVFAVLTWNPRNGKNIAA